MGCLCSKQSTEEECEETQATSNRRHSPVISRQPLLTTVNYPFEGVSTSNHQHEEEPANYNISKEHILQGRTTSRIPANNRQIRSPKNYYQSSESKNFIQHHEVNEQTTNKQHPSPFKQQKIITPTCHYGNKFANNREAPEIEEYIRKRRLRQVILPSKVVRNNGILSIGSDPYFDVSKVVTFIQLTEYDHEYHIIRRKVTNKRNFIIDSIERIENPYLKMAYELKKEQKRKQYQNLEERWLFHGTKQAHLQDICKFNFNWRLCKTHKYGAGISFSPNSTYASNYSDKYEYKKVMIVAKVLIGKSCLGHNNMIVPDDGCDTSQKGDDAIVVVKYEDNEFCPIFLIKYHLIDSTVGRAKNVNNSYKDYGRRQVCTGQVHNNSRSYYNYQ